MPPKKKVDKGGAETLTRIAIVSGDKCVGRVALVRSMFNAGKLLC